MTTLLEKKIFTYDDINSLPEGNYEIIDGERRDMTPTGFGHGYFESIIAELLRKHLGSGGYVAVGEVGVVISRNPFRLRAADVVYISKTKYPERPAGMLELPPELIVEIVSDDNTAKYINDKVKDYLSIGVDRVVLVDPYTETVTVYQHGRKEAGYYNFNDEFEIIRGLVVKLKEIA
ncbi:MAG: Uma2 family endonuclease [Dissulfurispiraceae bacterium]|jgi:Uma2 family endonuclease